MSSQDDARWMRLAVELAWLCPPSDSAYSVGAVIVAADGTELSRGFSRESDPVVHAEESALAKLGPGAPGAPDAPGDPRLPGATIYSTLEPCSLNAGSSVTSSPACSSSSHPWQSATNRAGSRQAMTTRRIPDAMISAVQLRGRDLRCEQGSSVL